MNASCVVCSSAACVIVADAFRCPVVYGTAASRHLQIPGSGHRHIDVVVFHLYFIPVKRINFKCEFATIGAESSDQLLTSSNEIPGRGSRYYVLLRGVNFVCRFAAGADHRHCNRCSCDNTGRRDCRLASHRDRCRSNGGCDRRFPSKICACTQFLIVCFSPVLIAAKCSPPDQRLPRIRVDVLRLEAVPVQSRASAR